MKFFEKFRNRSFYILFTVFMCWILLSSVIIQEERTVNVLVVSALLIIAAVAFSAVLVKMAERAGNIRAVTAAFVVMYLFLFAFAARTMTYPLNDLIIMKESVDYWLTNGNILKYSAYYTICENTLGNTIFMYFMFMPLFKMGIAVESNNAEIWGVAVNCFMIMTAVWGYYRIIEKYSENKSHRFIYICLSFVCVPIYLWSHRYYSDTLSLPFVPLAILAYLKASEQNSDIKKILWSVVSGVTVFAGFWIKGNVAVTAVAILIFSFFKDKKDWLKLGTVVLLSFIVTNGMWSYYKEHNSWIDYSNRATNDYPTTMWLMYGAHNEGNYCDEDAQYIVSLPDYATRKARAAQKLKEYYSAYTPSSYIKFLTLKYGRTYGNGTYDVEGYIMNSRYGNFTHYFLLRGMPFYRIFKYLCDGYNLLLLTFSVVFCIMCMRRGKWDPFMLIGIIAFGTILFLSFWETKARYGFSLVPVWLVFASGALSGISEFIYNKVKK